MKQQVPIEVVRAKNAQHRSNQTTQDVLEALATGQGLELLVSNLRVMLTETYGGVDGWQQTDAVALWELLGQFTPTASFLPSPLA